MKLVEYLRRWYCGETHDVGDPLPGGQMLYFQHYHWTAKVARGIVAFYLRNWKWVWTTLISAVSAATAAYAAIKAVC